MPRMFDYIGRELRTELYTNMWECSIRALKGEGSSEEIAMLPSILPEILPDGEVYEELYGFCIRVLGGGGNLQELAIVPELLNHFGKSPALEQAKINFVARVLKEAKSPQELSTMAVILPSIKDIEILRAELCRFAIKEFNGENSIHNSSILPVVLKHLFEEG